MLLYLIRHGESGANVTNRDLPDAALTPAGQVQAASVAGYLAHEGIHLVISSPLRRALETAEILRSAWGCTHIVWRDLTEHRHNEPHRFMGRAGVLASFPLAACEADLPEDGYDFGLERMEDAHGRAVRVLERLREQFGHTESRVAMAAHAGFNAFFLLAALGSQRQPDRSVEQANGCINRVLIEPERVRLLSVNETCHLRGR